MSQAAFRRVSHTDSVQNLRAAAAAAHIDTRGESDAQMEAELAEYEAHMAGGTHHIEQQLKEGLFTKNPRFFELVAYTFFLAAFLWLCINTQGGVDAFQMTSSIRNMLADFGDVSDDAGWFAFMESSFPELVVPTEYYNGNQLEKEHLGHIQNGFLLLGAISARQVRVKNMTCDLDPSDLIYPSVQNCFGEYSSKTEDRQPYGPLVSTSGSAVKFNFFTAKELGCRVGCSTSGWLASYQGGGFKEDLPSVRESNTTEAFKKKVAELKGDRWIDRQTRAVFVEFTIYSLPVELVAVVQLWYEKNAAGVVQTFVQVMPMKLGHMKFAETPNIDLAAEAFMFVMLLFYTGIAIRTMYQLGFKSYFSSVWNCMDVLNYMVFYGAFAARYAAVMNGASITFPPKDTDFIYTSAVASQIVFYKYLMGFNSILTLVRLFKLLSHVPFMARLVNILAGSAEDVLAFVLCCFVLLVGFAGAFHLTYGTHLKEWSTYTESFMSLYRMMHGEWDYDGMVEYSPSGVFYFFVWSLLSICLLMNMFVAIIMEAYDAVKEEEEKITMTQFLLQRFGNKDVDVVVEGDGKELDGADIETEKANADAQGKMRQDMELVLAALVDFRRDMKVLSKKVQQLTDNDGREARMRTTVTTHNRSLGAQAEHKRMDDKLLQLLRRNGLEDAVETLLQQGIYNADRLREIQEEDVEELGLPFATAKVFRRKRLHLLANLERMLPRAHENLEVTTSFDTEASAALGPEPSEAAPHVGHPGFLE